MRVKVYDYEFLIRHQYLRTSMPALYSSEKGCKENSEWSVSFEKLLSGFG